MHVFSSGQGAVIVTPSDTADLANGATKGLYIGGTGDVSVIMENGSEAKYTSMASGVIHPISVKRVKATGTTATNMLAVY